MARTNKLAQISQDLEQRIRSGLYGQGQRLPTENSLCQQYAVSRPTLARALSALRDKGLIRSTQGSGHYVTFADNPSLAVPADELSLGILAPRMEENESGFLFEQIFRCIASLSQQFNFSLVWNGVIALGHGASRQAVIRKMDEVVERYVKNGVKGVFFIPIEFHPAAPEINRLMLEKLAHYGIGVVLLDGDVEAWPARSQWDLVGIDNIAAGTMVTRHLLNSKPRRIDFLCEQFSANTVAMRRMGYQLALLESGIAPLPDWQHAGDLNDRAFLLDLLSAGMTDVVCANDFTAMKLLAACSQSGHSVNVVGFDNNEYSALMGIPLTTWKQPFEEIARSAIFAMLTRLQYPDDAPRHLQLGGTLIVRASCGQNAG